jgi:hypothetical protein
MPAVESELRRKPSADLSIEPEEFTEAAPPRPQFAQPERIPVMDAEPQKRPRIVVPIHLENRSEMAQRANARVAGNQDQRRTFDSVMPRGRTRRAVVAAGLILAFSGMLLATHKYVTSHWNPLTSVPQLSETFIIGQEGVTTTDVNLRPVANAQNQPIGLAESGSKVRILGADNNWYEVQVLEHARPKTDPYSSDRGWINKRFVKFD